jgi:hypothetical protein
MRSTVILFLALLPAVSAQAGTWIEDFEDGNLDGWTVRMPGGEWKIENGQLSASSRGASAIFMESSEWKDYTVEASVCLVEKLGGNDMEMELGLHADPAVVSGYGFVLQFSGGKYAADEVHIYRVTGPFQVSKLIAKRHELSENTWYRMKCSIAGNHLTFYIDDELVAEVDAAHFASGTVAISVMGIHMLIDDIVITGDDIPDRGSFRVVEPRGKLVTAWASIKLR